MSAKEVHDVISNNGDVESLRLILDKNPALAVEAFSYDLPPIWWAASQGRLGIVRFLVEEMGVDHDASNQIDCSPLSAAVMRRRLNVVQYLVTEAGADLEKTNHDGWTPLMHAVVYDGDRDIVEFLVESGANKHHKNNLGDSITYIARESRRFFDYILCEVIRKRRDAVEATVEEFSGLGPDVTRLCASYMSKKTK